MGSQGAVKSYYGSLNERSRPLSVCVCVWVCVKALWVYFAFTFSSASVTIIIQGTCIIMLVELP